MALSSLLVGERVVSRCDDGLLEAEYALFERSEVLLSATATGHAVQELGYMTTAGYARARLHQAGVTRDLAYETFASLGARGYPRRLARTQAVIDVLESLGPHEAFEGGAYRADTRRYAGVWLDLDALAAACPVPDAGLLFQVLHLVLVLEEVDENVPVRLLTAEATEAARPGERTWHKIPLGTAQDLPRALRSMPVLLKLTGIAPDEADVREEILRNLKVRSTSASVSQPRLQALASALARRRSTPPPGAVARPTPPPGASPLFDELRRHTELLRGDAHLRDVAQFLSAMADRRTSVPELAMLAARAWLAAGEAGHARYFARSIVDDVSVADDVRLTALEVLDSTNVTHESMVPPPISTIEPAPVIVLSSTEPDRPAPPGASLPPSAPDTERMPVLVAMPTAHPPIRRLSAPEIVETLQLPPGLNDNMLAPAEMPRDPNNARILMTRLARELGRDYRLWYGTALKTDVIAIDAMQRHLRRRFSEGTLDEPHARQLEAELTRHGALLSEILARRLGAEWVDLESEKPGHWAMSVPPQVRVWPIGRVYRFFRQGHREADLVAFYAELELGMRSSQR
jgi:hypothetical protein